MEDFGYELPDLKKVEEKPEEGEYFLSHEQFYVPFFALATLVFVVIVVLIRASTALFLQRHYSGFTNFVLYFPIM